MSRSTVPRSTGARSTAPRWTVPRWSAALSLRDTNTSSLRSEVTSNQTGPDRGDEPLERADLVPGRVGSGREDADTGSDDADDASSSLSSAGGRGPAPVAGGPPGPGAGASGGGLSGRAAGLLGACLPSSMRVLDAAGAREVAGLLEERVGAGWRPSEIRRVMDQRLPERCGRLASLVAYRLRANVDPGLAPARLVAAEGRAVSEEARHERARRRSEELAGTVRPGPDAAGGEAWARVRRCMPGAGRLAQALEVNRLLDGGEGLVSGIGAGAAS